MSFLMMAAHDTLTSSLTSFVYYLAANPNWQEKVREEIRDQGSRRMTRFLSIGSTTSCSPRCPSRRPCG